MFNISANLKKFIKNNEIKAFCSKNNIPYRTFQEIYYGNTKDPRISIMFQIAKALNVEIEKLLLGDDDLVYKDLSSSEE